MSLITDIMKASALVSAIGVLGAAGTYGTTFAVHRVGGPDTPYASGAKQTELAQNLQQMQRGTDQQINALKAINQSSALGLLPLWQGERTKACIALHHNPENGVAMQNYTTADGHVKALEAQLGMLPSDGCPK